MKKNVHSNSLEWEGNERYSHDEQVEKVERRSAEGSVMKYEPVSYSFETNFNSEDRCEKNIEVIQDLSKEKWGCIICNS